MSGTKIFVSYSRRESDRAWLNAFTNALKELNDSVWVDRPIEPGDKWAETLESALLDSTAIVAVVSDVEGNANLYFELGLAIGSGKRMILVVDPSATDSLPAELRHRKWITLGAAEETARKVTIALEEPPY